jgi:glycosyltransferase involved in cell wall biosynthesis
MESILNNKLLSIVTISYNSAEYIEKCIKSVVVNKNPFVEYIVIDGGSTDSTIEIVEKFNLEIDFFISEKDFGISHAFNKGVFNSKGKYICFLNSDDFYMPCVIDDIIDVIQNSNDEFDLIYGQTEQFDNEVVNLKKSYRGPVWVSFPFTFGASFYKKSLFEKYGLFDLNKKIGMDVDFLLRIWRYIKVKELPCTLLRQRAGGISDKQRVKGYFEYFCSAKKEYGNVLAAIGFCRKYLAYFTKKIGVR